MSIESRHQRLLANRYQVIDLIGNGAMGQVYRAEDQLLGGVTVAVKFLSQALLNQQMRGRFEREATISALLGEKSIHIVRVKDYGVDEKETPFYVMEFLQGQSLNEMIKSRPLPLPRYLNLTRQICYGLECAHKGIIFQGELCPIVHRDIKPSNILVIQDSALGEMIKIFDFGIAKLIQSGESQTQSFMGTLAYCSPEQMQGKELDGRSDIYSLGVMMYEMVSGEMPLYPNDSSIGGWYEAHHRSEPKALPRRMNLPDALECLIMKCLAKAPDERPQSIGEILQALEKIESQVRGTGLQAVDQSAKAASAQQKPPAKSKSSLSTKEVCWQSIWPEKKTRQKIVFPRSLESSQGEFASLWVMLESTDISNRLASLTYSQFLFLPTSHPMILWMTLLYHQEYGPRWLPCYLDLETTQGQALARILSRTGKYWILFFALDGSGKCENILSVSLSKNQCQMLEDLVSQREVAKEKETTRERYLKKVEEILSFDGEISIPGQDTLDELREELGLSLAEADALKAQAFEPYKKYQENCQKYEKTFLKVIQQEYPLSEKSKQSLKLRQRDLGIKLEDAEQIENRILLQVKSNISEQFLSVSKEDLAAHNPQRFQPHSKELSPDKQNDANSQSAPEIHIPLNPVFLERCQQELAHHIGPIAQFILQDAIAEHPQIEPRQLVELLSEEISNPQNAKQFKEQLLQIIN